MNEEIQEWEGRGWGADVITMFKEFLNFLALAWLVLLFSVFSAFSTNIYPVSCV